MVWVMWVSCKWVEVTKGEVVTKIVRRLAACVDEDLGFFEEEDSEEVVEVAKD